MEPSDDSSQSTPPLSGVWGNGVPHPNLGYSSERTPVLRVQKLPYRLVIGRGGEVGDGETTPLLSQEGGGGGGVGQERGREEVVGEGTAREKREEGGEIIEENETGTPDDQPQEVGAGGKEERRQLLSLKRGKKRSSGNFSTSLSPSDKKPRLDLEDTPSTAGVPGEQSAAPPQQRTAPISQSVGKRQTDKGDKLGQLPEMFAPDGVPTAVYTATILNVFNSYIQQLREAQGKVLSLIPWSKPIPSSLRQPLTSLTWGPALSHRAARPAGHHHNWPSIDLRSGEIVRSSPGSSSARRTGSQRRRRRANIEEDDDEESLPPSLAGGSGSPSRPQISLKQKDTETAESERKWFIPSECPSVGKSRESTGRVVSVSPSPDSPPHSSHKKLLPSPVNSDPHTDRPGNTAEINSNTKLHLSPEAETVSGSLPISAGEGSGETMAEVEDGHLTPSHEGGEGVGEDESQDGGEGVRKGDREVGGGGGGGGNGEVASSAEDADDVLFCGQRRKRTKLFDDSDSENECGSKTSHAGNDVICAINSKPAAREGPEEGKKSSLFARARAAFGGGKRTKRQSFQPLPVRTVAGGKPCSAEPGDSVVDLTEEPTAVEERIDHGQQQVEEEEVVACPLCSELFSHSSIEAHAASCGETRETSSKSYTGQVGKRVSHQLPLRQSSLITPRFTR